MKLTVNRKPTEYGGEPTVTALLAHFGVNPQTVAVAVNGDVVPRTDWAQCRLRDGDTVDIVHVVAGGSGDAEADDAADDPLIIAGRSFRSRLILGTGKYPDAEVMKAAFAAAECEMVTVAIRHMNLENPAEGSLLEHIDTRRYALLPNTAGATTREQAVRLARLAREATGTHWIKLEIIGEPETLWPDVTATIEATRQLVDEGFVVLPYTSTDLVAALQLEAAGAATVMPLAAPIGSGQGLIDWASIKRIVQRVKVPVIVDAGLGVPSDAAQALELGADAVLVNTAIARAQNPVRMARAFKLGVEAGRLAYRAGRIPKREHALPSSPTEGVPV